MASRSCETLMTALAMVRAYRDGRDEDLAVLAVSDDDDALPGVLAMAGRFLDEIEALGGDAEGLLRRIYDRATVPV
jgi:hypothetical protein